jgi:geranylgeranyl pyrophosphate synthase
LTGQVCEAETEQELVLRGAASSWEKCVSVARRKTGALFAFMAAACGGEDPDLTQALLEAGFKAGTAYQLADDILDGTGDPDEAGKSLGSDLIRETANAITASQECGVDPVEYIENLCAASEQALAPWPAARESWQRYLNLDLRPALHKNLACFSR